MLFFMQAACNVIVTYLERAWLWNHVQLCRSQSTYVQLPFPLFSFFLKSHPYNIQHHFFHLLHVNICHENVAFEKQTFPLILVSLQKIFLKGECLQSNIRHKFIQKWIFYTVFPHVHVNCIVTERWLTLISKEEWAHARLLMHYMFTLPLISQLPPSVDKHRVQNDVSF